MFKKIIITLITLLSFHSAFALEFLDTTLENLNRTELKELLIHNGAKLTKKDTLVDTFSLKNSKIPYAEWALAYFNPKGDFVGLKIGFGYDDHNLINLRKALVKKYGSNYVFTEFFGEHLNSNALDKDFFSDKAIWKFANNTSIEFNSSTFDQNRLSDLSSFAFLFFRHDERKSILINQLKEQSKRTDDDKFKGVF